MSIQLCAGRRLRRLAQSAPAAPALVPSRGATHGERTRVRLEVRPTSRSYVRVAVGRTPSDSPGPGPRPKPVRMMGLAAAALGQVVQLRDRAQERFDLADRQLIGRR